MFMQKFNDLSRKKTARTLALLLIFVFSPATANAQQANPTTIINAARILDVKSGKYLNNYAVLVVDGRVGQIAPRAELARNAPRGAKIVNLPPNATLLPGLIDAHTHLLDERLLMQEFYDNNAVRITQRSPEERMALGERNAREMVEAGWTTVRDLGMAKDCDALKLRDRINAGQTIGPRMFVACKLLTPPGGLLLRPASEYAEEMIRNEYFEIRTEEDARRAVGENVQAGADVIKVVVADEERMLTLPQVRAIVEAAHQANLKVAGHAHTAEAAQIAVDGGVDSVEHAFQVRDATLRQMRERGIFLVPTDLSIAAVNELFARMLPPGFEPRPGIKKYRKEQVESAPERLKRAIAMKVRLAAGSDVQWIWTGRTRGTASLLILDAFRQAGMSPLDVIRAATVNAAELLGQSENVGAIETNKFADLIAVEGDPLVNFAALKRVVFVMKNGEILKNR